ncbi:MAG: urease, partial [SAR116 cluster bacterium]|nr:urease [SAR116 cluster bacterium]
MLQLKPNCECCDCDLPPDSVEAMMCSYECT